MITYAERNGRGRRLTDIEIAQIVFDCPNGGGEWKHIHTVATIIGESEGYEWVRPIVYKPGTVYHLSIDRGICQFSSAQHPDGRPASHWASIPDNVAFDATKAIAAMVQWLHEQSLAKTRESSTWDWRPLLDWQWHSYGSPKYPTYVLRARAAVNDVRIRSGLKQV